MDFKQWLNENAHRTGTRIWAYPPGYDTHGIDETKFPFTHIPTAADLFVCLEMKPKKFHWKNFDSTNP